MTQSNFDEGKGVLKKRANYLLHDATTNKTLIITLHHKTNKNYYYTDLSGLYGIAVAL